MSLFVIDFGPYCIDDGNPGMMELRAEALAETSNQQMEGDP